MSWGVLSHLPPETPCQLRGEQGGLCPPGRQHSRTDPFPEHGRRMVPQDKPKQGTNQAGVLPGRKGHGPQRSPPKALCWARWEGGQAIPRFLHPREGCKVLHFLGDSEVLESPPPLQPPRSPEEVGSPKVPLSSASTGAPRGAGGSRKPLIPCTLQGHHACHQLGVPGLATPPQPSETALSPSPGRSPRSPVPGCPVPLTHARCAVPGAGPGAFESSSSVPAGQHWPSLAQSECEAGLGAANRRPQRDAVAKGQDGRV